MKILRKDGTTHDMTIKEFGARLWPFGKWVIVWNHILDGKKDGPKIVDKLTAVNAYIMHQAVEDITRSRAMSVVGIRKVGGWFDGVEYRPAMKK